MYLNKISYYFIFLVSVLAVSCIKDRSNKDLIKINSIVIDTSKFSKDFTLFPLDSIKMDPNVSKVGADASKFKYEWSINDFGGYKRIVSTQKAVNLQVTERPNTGSTYYTLVFVVTDTTTGQKGLYTWTLHVIPKLGDGLVVVDTKDGINSDLSLIRTYYFTESMFDVEPISKVFYHQYSAINGRTIPGLINSISYVLNASSGGYGLTLATKNSLTQIDPYSYKLVSTDNQLFALPQDVIAPSCLYACNAYNQHEYLINNGKAFHRFPGGAFLSPFNADIKGYSCTKICGLQTNSISLPGGALYDETNNRFLLIANAISSTKDLLTIPNVDNSAPAPAYDPNNMGNKTCLFMGEYAGSKVLAVLKDRTQSNYYAYQLNTSITPTGKIGTAMNDLSNYPEISSAKYFATSTLEPVLFYATDTKIYSSVLSTGGQTVNTFTVPAGEKITGMRQHTGTSNYGWIYLPPTDNVWDDRGVAKSSNRLIMISTYNATTKEGKIYCLPVQYLGAGQFMTSSDPRYLLVFGGFDQITDFGLQEK